MRLNGSIQLDGDKSISIRMILFSILSGQGSKIGNICKSRDVFSSIRCIEKLGLSYDSKTCRINKIPISASNFFDCDNSGTTARLLIGILCGLRIPFKITGDGSLTRRPMKRIIIPLQRMGIELIHTNWRLPIEVKSYKEINALRYELPIASAQLKSCIILAALGANGKSQVIEKNKSRSHTEKILKMMGANIAIDGNKINISVSKKIKTVNYNVPGDISSAAFLIQMTLISRGSSIIIKNSILSKERVGFIHVLKSMKANIEIKNQYIDEAKEEVGDIIVKSSELRAIDVAKEIIPSCIDEIPVLAACATQASGQTVIRGVEELKYKESDRLELIVGNLKRMKADIFTNGKDIVINGKKKLYSTTIITRNDHRIFMAFYALSMALGIKLDYDIEDSFVYSYPNFIKDIKRLQS
tara:strand:+ start:157 stop:1398 length:1242 start_codon:yes stop_codon:yes gene_type:complete